MSGPHPSPPRPRRGRNGLKACRYGAYRGVARCFPWVLGLFFALVPLHAQINPLTTIKAIAQLQPYQAAHDLPVSLNATVSYYALEPGRDQTKVVFYVQDATGGIPIQLAGNPIQAVAGDKVQILGSTMMGAEGPEVLAIEVNITGHGALPPVPVASLDDLKANHLDGQLIAASGILDSPYTTPDGLAANLSIGGGKLILPLGGQIDASIAAWVGRQVQVEGVETTVFDSAGTMIGRRLLVAGMHYVVPQGAAVSTAQTAPLKPIAHLYRYIPGDIYSGFVRVRGTVTYHQPGGETFLQDDTGGLALSASTPGQFLPGTEIEVTGRAAMLGNSPELMDASARRLGPGIPPVPEAIDSRQAFTGRFNDQIVTITGRLLSAADNAQTHLHTLVLTANGDIFTVSAQGPWKGLRFPRPPPQSELRVTGICVAKALAGETAQSVRILAPSPADIAVLSTPAWWHSPKVLWALGILVAGIALALFWGGALRLRILQQDYKLNKNLKQQMQLEQQLQESQKLEAIGRLAGGVAHDFNNLLTVIAGHADILKQKSGEDPQLSRGLEAIQKASDRAGTITRQLLAYSRRQEMQPAVLDFNSILENMTEMLQSLVGSGVKVTSLPGTGLPAVRADQSQIERVVMNLVVNARDAMPNGGDLALATERVEWAGESGRKAAEAPPGTYVRLSVRDNGTGMSDEVLERIFDPFFTTKDQGKGTGLGLSTVYGIVRQSGGFIRVQSKLGEGSTFEVYLPAVSSTRAAEPESSLPVGESDDRASLIDPPSPTPPPVPYVPESDGTLEDESLPSVPDLDGDPFAALGSLPDHKQEEEVER